MSLITLLKKHIQKLVGLFSFYFLLTTLPLFSIDERGFEGIQAGIFTGVGDAASKDMWSNRYRAFSGVLTGIYVSGVLSYGRLSLGLDVAHTRPLFKKSTLSNLSPSLHEKSLDFGVKIGWRIKDKAMPFARVGYAINSLTSYDSRKNLWDVLLNNGSYQERTFAPFLYGGGIDLKLLSRIIIGVDAYTSSHKTEDFTSAFFNVVRIKCLLLF